MHIAQNMMNVCLLATRKKEIGEPTQNSFTVVRAGSRLHYEIPGQKFPYCTKEAFDAYLTGIGQSLVM
jgi:hypothetical protein